MEVVKQQRRAGSMPRQQHVHSKLIDALGGNTKVAAELGRDHTTVSRWRVNGITPRAWPSVARLAAAAGIKITAEQLEATSPPFGRGGTSRNRMPMDGRRVPPINL
jgi:hypothetical protein